jgi:beta-galactosidase
MAKPGAIDEHQALTEVVGRWWEDPTLTSLNRLPARASTRSHRSLEEARSGAGARWCDLDSDWWFRLLDSPVEAPAGWTMARTTKAAGWRPIDVPGNWTMQDTGDLPQYTNVVMPFPGDPPTVPEHNPTGLHRRRITGSDLRRAGHRRGDRVILHLGGAESAAAIWLNGTFVGIASDSRLASEFDVTELVRDEANDLAVMVVRWSAWTWIEDQDHWFHGGMARRVALRTCGRTNLADVSVSANLDNSLRRGDLRVSCRVDGDVRGWRVRTHLETLGGRRVAGTASEAPVSMLDVSSHIAAQADGYRHPGPLARTSVRVDRPAVWSHEDPTRYRVMVSLVDPRGRVREVVPVTTGFTRVEIVGPELLLNGAPLLIAGVNRHDHHHLGGKAASDAELRADVENIKRCGFNAIRTSHYPPDPVVLDTCDEIGLWVVCEANVESHARWNEVMNDPRFATAFMERVQRTVLTHRNHPSIMGWSLGNESGHGAVHDAASAWVRRTDPRRFVQYEGAITRFWRGQSTDRRNVATDIECPMYASVDAIERWVTDGDPVRPLILCEYTHAMGNSNGGLRDYWRAFETRRGLQGGFVWDWRDQGLITTDESGRPYPGYGGAFGDEPNDAAFCCNGIVGWDGTPHPGVEEHRWLTRPVRSEARVDAGRIVLDVENGRAWTDLADLRGSVTVAVDGQVVIERAIDASRLRPGRSRTFALGAMPTATGEVTVTVEWTTARRASWAPAGHRVAWDQTVLSDAAGIDPPMRRRGSTDALVEAMELARSAEVSLWRAPIDNDGVEVGPLAGIAGVSPLWRRLGLNEISSTVRSHRHGDDTETLVLDCVTATGERFTHHRRISLDDGWIVVDEDLALPRSWTDLPRVGVSLGLSADLDRLRWYGRGPWETAVDRPAAPLGVWSSSVADQFVPYMTPQHHGTHIDARWLALTDTRGRGWAFRLDGLAFDASIYSVDELTRAATLADLEPSDRVHLHIDSALRGVGTAACGPDTDVIVLGGRHRFVWRLARL